MANGPTGISPPNSSAIIVSTQGIGFPAGGEGGRVGGMGVHDAADPVQVGVDVAGGEGVRRRRGVALDDRPVEVGDHHVLRRQPLVVDPGRFDHQQVGARHPGGDVAGGPHDQVPPDEFGVQITDLDPQPLDVLPGLWGELHTRTCPLVASRRRCRRIASMPFPPRPK